MIVHLPYHRSCMKLELDRATVLEPGAASFVPDKAQEELVQDALAQPVQSQRLCALAEGKSRALVITSDHTRPVPSRITLPLLLAELRGNNPDIEVRILIATGVHRPMTAQEMQDKFGEELVERECFLNHLPDDPEIVCKGILPSGGELWLNGLVDWADIVVSEGFIEPHFFAGFSGGRKSILPGIAGRKTVLANHCAEFIASARAVTGNLEGNPIHADMLFAAGAANLQFILNVALDSEKRIIASFAGAPEQAHREGCAFVDRLASVDAVASDIVITTNGGYPLDQNIYQAVKGMTAAEGCVVQGGVIVMVAACSDGIGGDDFHRWFRESDGCDEVLEKIAPIGRNETLPDQWQAQILARVLKKATVILVTDMCDRETVEDFHMLHASSLEDAMEKAFAIMGHDARVTVIPDGVGVIVR